MYVIRARKFPLEFFSSVIAPSKTSDSKRSVLPVYTKFSQRDTSFKKTTETTNSFEIRSADLSKNLISSLKTIIYIVNELIQAFKLYRMNYRKLVIAGGLMISFNSVWPLNSGSLQTQR